MKIGLYGGTFDPIHIAHLLIAQYVRDELRLDKIIFIPASIPPHKKNTTPSDLRLKMVEAAIADNSSFECSRIETEREGKSYSYDTICAIKESYKAKKNELFWIIGSDNFCEFHTWHKPEKIFDLCTVIVFPRTRDDSRLKLNPFFNRVHFLKTAPLIEISSSEIRSRITNGQSVNYYLPDRVERIISSNNLYK